MRKHVYDLENLFEAKKKLPKKIPGIDRELNDASKSVEKIKNMGKRGEKSFIKKETGLATIPKKKYLLPGEKERLFKNIPSGKHLPATVEKTAAKAGKKLSKTAKGLGAAALLAGAAYGGKKLYDKNKASKAKKAEEANKRKVGRPKKESLTESIINYLNNDYKMKNLNEGAYHSLTANVAKKVGEHAAKSVPAEAAKKKSLDTIKKLAAKSGKSVKEFLASKNGGRLKIAAGGVLIGTTALALRNNELKKKKVEAAKAKLAAKRAAKASGKKLNESAIIDAGLTPNQFLFDREVLKNIHNLSESAEQYQEARNAYFTDQRNVALEYGYEDAAEYYDSRIK
jgi:predicted alpha/beta-fold hydrolase